MMYSNAFESFSCPTSMSIGLSIDGIAKVLKLCGPADKLTIEADADQNKVIWTFETTSDKRMAYFEMNTMEIEQEALGIPEMKYEAVVNMPTAVFKKAVSDLKDVGDVVSLNASKAGLRLGVEGDFGTADLHLAATVDQSAKEEETLKVDLADGVNEVSLNFGMRFISLFTKATPLCKMCTLNMKSGEPMTLHYAL